MDPTDALAAFNTYADHNGLTSLPSLQQKLPPDQLASMLRAPLFKLDSIEVGQPFAEYASNVYNTLPPPPLLLHYMAFELGGFDHNVRFPLYECRFDAIRLMLWVS